MLELSVLGGWSLVGIAHFAAAFGPSRLPQASPPIAPRSESVFGAVVASVPDCNRDGIDDVAVGDAFFSDHLSRQGAVFVLCGKSGVLIHTLLGERKGSALGTAIASVDGPRRDSTATSSQAVWSVSASGNGRGDGYALLFQAGLEGLASPRVIRGADDQRDFGRSLSLAFLEGEDRRYRTSLLVSSLIQENPSDPPRYKVQSMDVETGTEMWSKTIGYGDGTEMAWIRHVEDANGKPFAYWPEYDARGACIEMVDISSGSAMRSLIPHRPELSGRGKLLVGKFTGDSAMDFLVASPGWREGSDYDVGVVELRRGAAGTLTRKHSLGEVGFGANIESVGDCDGDGGLDYAIATYDSLDTGRVRVFSGRKGTLMYVLSATGCENATYFRFGVAISGSGDVDGDNVNDIIIGACNPHIPTEMGRVFVYSGEGGKWLWSAALTNNHVVIDHP